MIQAKLHTFARLRDVPAGVRTTRHLLASQTIAEPESWKTAQGQGPSGRVEVSDSGVGYEWCWLTSSNCVTRTTIKHLRLSITILLLRIFSHVQRTVCQRHLGQYYLKT